MTASLGSSKIPSLWSAPNQRVCRQLHQSLPFDRVAVTIPGTTEPTANDLVVASGWNDDLPPTQLPSFRDDRLVASARERGFAVSSPEERTTDVASLSQAHILLVRTTVSLHAPLSWELLLVRKAGGFASEEIVLADLILKKWYCQFALPPEAGLGQMLFDDDGRLLAMDLATQASLIHDNSSVLTLGRSLPDVMRQRYPDLASERRYDLCCLIGSTPRWLSVCRRQVLDGAHWHVESRPLATAELAVTGRLQDDRIARALGFIESHYTQTPQLADIAAIAKMSPFHFHRQFSQAVGLSPKQYVLLKQIEVGRWLLRTTLLTVSDIAKRTGFLSHGHFTSAFCRIAGQTPTEYRKGYAESHDLGNLSM